jgi:hypothetical protein
MNTLQFIVKLKVKKYTLFHEGSQEKTILPGHSLFFRIHREVIPVENNFYF